MDSGEITKKRLLDLAKRSYEGGYYLFSDFLDLAAQAELVAVRTAYGHGSSTTFGGAEGAERVMARFGSEEDFGYSEDFPIACIRCEPKSMKFADKLTHRDFLGALMNLGIERSTLGDIVVCENVGYIFAKMDICEFIVTELTRVKRTDVVCTLTEGAPEGELYKTERRVVQAVGERVDAVIAKVFSISREESLSYFKRRLVFVDGRQMENNSYIPKVGERVSVRGLGRFIYLGYQTLSKKGKLNIEVDLYV